MPALPSDVSTLSYEQALSELDSLIGRLEHGLVELDEAIACYERGMQLAQRCSELLDQTEHRVMQLVIGAGGRAEERPFSADAGDAAPVANPAAAPSPGRPAGQGPSRARSVAAQSASGLFPGLDPAPRRADQLVDLDPDDIPF